MFRPEKRCKGGCYDASCAEQTRGLRSVFERIRNALRKGTENKEEGA